MSAEVALFYLLGVLAVLAALGMLMAKNVIYSVLCMVLNFVFTGFLYLLLDAPFIAAAQIIVYAGAIMVLFLFVVMLLGNQELARDEPLPGQRLWGVAGVTLLGALLGFVVLEGVPAASPKGLPADKLPALPGGFGSPQAIGDLLFRDYVLPFEVVSVLLLVAILGAVVIAKFRTERRGIGTGPIEEGDR